MHNRIHGNEFDLQDNESAKKLMSIEKVEHQDLF